MTRSFEKRNVCCLCHKDFIGWGNNPAPVLRDATGTAVCCDDCNMNIVLPARMEYLRGK